MSKVNILTQPEEINTEALRTQKAKILLGLDLGTNCGYCISYLKPGVSPVKNTVEPYNIGIMDLSAGPYDSGAIRFVRMRHFLNQIKPDLVAYEEVKFTPSEAITKFSAARVLARAATSSELIGAFRATLVTWCEEHNVPCTGFPIGTIKKKATGKGNAGKPDMIKACNKLINTDFEPDTYEQTGADNVADAVFVNALLFDSYASGMANAYP